MTTIDATRSENKGTAAPAVALTGPGASAAHDTVMQFQTRQRLTFDLDVDVCVVGAGLAGLTLAREVARLGASVAVLEGRHVGWNASGHNLGIVMPGFGHPVTNLIERVGYDDAREMWALAQDGVDYIRSTVNASDMPNMAMTHGVLEVSHVDHGDRLIRHLQMLNGDFATDAEGWQVERVRDVLRTRRYFHGLHYPGAFHLDGRRYVHGLAALAEQAGVRIFEDTPVISLDAAGIRKRIATPSARLRASHVVLAGGVHLGAPLRRLSDTLLPVWRYAAITAPLGERLADVMSFAGAVTDSDGMVQYRIVDGDRLMWSGTETMLPGKSWSGKNSRVSRAIEQQIRRLYPSLDHPSLDHPSRIEIAEVFGGTFGQTVHGMPQIGELHRGVWVASGFGRQGLNTSAMAGQLIARGILHGDDRWRLFTPFELVWAGGTTGKIAGQIANSFSRLQATTAGAFARYREGARARGQVKEARLSAANRNARQNEARRQAVRAQRMALASRSAASRARELEVQESHNYESRSED
jgi:glycine/D-amino acid oxidase-like deaminating enzyme